MSRVRALALLLAGALGCAAPAGSSDFGLVLSPGYGPAASAGLALEQRIVARERLQVDLVLGFSEYVLERTPAGEEDGFDARAWLRATLGPREGNPGAWQPWLGLGAVWLRARGEPDLLDQPGDYGGVLVAAGCRRGLGRHLALGPRVEFLLLDAEGHGSSAVLPRAAVDLVWYP